MAKIKKRTNPCFCSESTPPGCTPYIKYAVRLIEGNADFPGYVDWVPYFYNEDAITIGECAWVPPVATPLYLVEQLWIVDGGPGNFDHAYTFNLFLSNVVLGFHSVLMQASDGWYNTTEPFDCDIFLALGQDTFEMSNLFDIALAEVRAIPMWVCNAAQANAWIAAHPD